MQIGQDLGGGGVLHGYILGLFILVDGQVIAVFHDLVLGDEEGFCSAGVSFLGIFGEIATPVYGLVRNDSITEFLSKKENA